MSEQKSILTDLLGGFPVQQFLNDYYLKGPFARREEGLAFCSLGQWPVVEGLLAHVDTDVLVGQGGMRYSGSAPRTRCEAHALLAQGFTIGVRHADRIDPGLAEIAERFRSALRAPVDLHLYCTPATQQGFGWHYDAEEVFVLQTEGSKTWSLRKNTVNPWPLIDSIPQNQHYEREITPVLRCTLHPGDWSISQAAIGIPRPRSPSQFRCLSESTLPPHLTISTRLEPNWRSRFSGGNDFQHSCHLWNRTPVKRQLRSSSNNSVTSSRNLPSILRRS